MTLELYLYEGEQLIREASDKYPHHTLQKGYLCSKSSETGFNSFVYAHIQQDLFSIFEPFIPQPVEETIYEQWDERQRFQHSHPVYSKTHLKRCLDRVEGVIRTLKTLPDYGIKTIETFSDALIQTTQEALEYTKKESEKQNNYTYETNQGWFSFQSPLKVVAIIPTGLSNDLPAYVSDLLPNFDTTSQGVHLIYEVEGLMQHYIEIAEICAEFIEKALTLNEPRISGFSH